MEYDISHLLRDPVGCQWEVGVDEVGSAEPVKGERIRGQLRLTRFNQGVWTEARLRAEIVQVCDRCLRSYRQPVRVDFAEMCRIGEPPPADLEYGDVFVDSGGVLDLDEVFRQHLILNLPAKLLCNPQCVGICPHCGVYGDKYNHNCRTRGQEIQAESRWSELATLAAYGERGR